MLRQYVIARTRMSCANAVSRGVPVATSDDADRAASAASSLSSSAQCSADSASASSRASAGWLS